MGMREEKKMNDEHISWRSFPSCTFIIPISFPLFICDLKIEGEEKYKEARKVEEN